MNQHGKIRARNPLEYLVVLFVVLSLGGCTTRAESGSTDDALTRTTLTVFAAASLSDAFEEIATEFERANPNVEVALNLAGSQQLAQQIRLGAPADVFASANQAQMKVAVASGRISDLKPNTFVQNRLVVVVPATNPANLNCLKDLAKPGVSVIMASEAVPIGRYTQEVLLNASGAYDQHFQSQVVANVVSYEQNVRAILTKISLGEADAGIIYASDLTNTANVQTVAIPDSLNTIAQYPIAALADSKAPSQAEAFVAFVNTSQSQSILNRLGFITREAG